MGLEDKSLTTILTHLAESNSFNKTPSPFSEADAAFTWLQEKGHLGLVARHGRAC